MGCMEIRPHSILSRLRWILRQRWMYRWSVRVLAIFIGVALLAGSLANDRPLYCEYQGKIWFPAWTSTLVKWGWMTWPEEFHREDWLQREYDRVVFAPVPYSPGYLDLANSRHRGPFDVQEVKHWRFRHWLGTDQLGRDVLSGMIHGARSALLVGMLGAGIALLIGMILGGSMGFFGDDKLKAGPLTGVGVVSGAVLGVFYGLRTGEWMPGGPGVSLLSGCMAGLGIAALFIFIGVGMDRRLGWQRWRLPLDLMLMRVVEAVQAMPGMLLLLAMIPLFLSPSVWNVILIIGLIRWPGVARFVRGEMLKIREMPYIEAAEGSGIGRWRIFWRHALPNTLQPLIVVAAFSVSSGILLEAFLSFLGLGLPADQVSWGSLLNQARKNFEAWWLAVFPGIGIFLTVASFNLLGDAVQEWLDRRKPYLR